MFPLSPYKKKSDIKNRIIIAGLLLAGGVSAIQAQEASDSIASDDSKSTELTEVVVQGRTQRIIQHGVEYIPDKKTKRTSHDAVSLLQRMQIPQLSVSPVESDIKTFSGAAVSVFIDYIPASAEELSGLRPEDVIKVEVLDYPTDPRFNSASHVVNFIMQKYEWGGYTKLGAVTFFPNVWHVNGSLYSKMAYKKITVDASVNGSWSGVNSRFSESRETFRGIEYGSRA